MNEKEESPQPRPRKRGGRSPKTNPAVFRYTVNFDAVEHARFLTLFEQSGLLQELILSNGCQALKTQSN